MVQNTNFIKTKNSKIIQLKQNLNCTNFGIYATYCNICSEIYIGQTINRFSVCWNTHCHIWNNSTLDSEKAALSIHYHKNHTDFPYKNKPILECYTVTFLQQPSNSYLDICESLWIHLLDASKYSNYCSSYSTLNASLFIVHFYYIFLFLYFFQAFFLHIAIIILKEYTVLTLPTYTLHFTTNIISVLI